MTRSDPMVNEVEKNRLLRSKQAMYKAGRARRDAFVAAMRDGCTLPEACARVGVANGTYRKWRIKYREFAAEVDMYRLAPHELTVGFNGTFAQFREKYFGMKSTWFHILIINAIENAQPGSITVILIPPEHGKTTLMEDYCNYKLAIDPQTRISYGSGKQGHSKKVLRRIMGRMIPEGPAKEYVIRFGPFAPQEDNRRKVPQAWNADYFDVFKKADFDERDYNMVALGMTAQIQGTRTDLLIVDDPQSLETLGQTDQITEKFRQDWLSRVGKDGRTICVGTRVGDWDFWQALMDADIIDNLICIPAHDPERGWLWPENYNEAFYEKKKKVVGPVAWARNYMQDPISSGEETFTEEIINKALNPLRSIIMAPERRANDPAIPVYIGIDPSIGGKNATGACAFYRDKMTVLDIRTDQGLTDTAQLAQVAEDMIVRYNIPGISVSKTVVAETMAFQKALETDPAFEDLKTRYGITLRGHLTNYNKLDPELGVAAMVRSFQMGEIEIPYAQDELTQHRIGRLIAELRAWRPNVRGSKLRQDLVMVMWFLWLQWRSVKETAYVDTSQFDSPGLPYRQPLIIVSGRAR